MFELQHVRPVNWGIILFLFRGFGDDLHWKRYNWGCNFKRTLASHIEVPFLCSLFRYRLQPFSRPGGCQARLIVETPSRGRD